MNQLRSLMAEFGIVVGEGPAHMAELVAILADPNDHRIPAPLLDGLVIVAELLHSIEQKLEAIDKQLVSLGRDNANGRHLITIPGYGPILSSAMAALVTNPAASTAAGTSPPRSVWCRAKTAPEAR